VGWSYVPCKAPENGPSPWCTQARTALLAMDPSGTWLGCFNPRKIRGNARRWSVHACGRAV